MAIVRIRSGGDERLDKVAAKNVPPPNQDNAGIIQGPEDIPDIRSDLEIWTAQQAQKRADARIRVDVGIKPLSSVMRAQKYPDAPTRVDVDIKPLPFEMRAQQADPDFGGLNYPPQMDFGTDIKRFRELNLVLKSARLDSQTRKDFESEFQALVDNALRRSETGRGREFASLAGQGPEQALEVAGLERVGPGDVESRAAALLEPLYTLDRAIALVLGATTLTGPGSWSGVPLTVRNGKLTRTSKVLKDVVEGLSLPGSIDEKITRAHDAFGAPKYFWGIHELGAAFIAPPFGAEVGLLKALGRGSIKTLESAYIRAAIKKARILTLVSSKANATVFRRFYPDNFAGGSADDILHEVEDIFDKGRFVDEVDTPLDEGVQGFGEMPPETPEFTGIPEGLPRRESLDQQGLPGFDPLRKGMPEWGEATTRELAELDLVVKKGKPAAIPDVTDLRGNAPAQWVAEALARGLHVSQFRSQNGFIGAVAAPTEAAAKRVIDAINIPISTNAAANFKRMDAIGHALGYEEISPKTLQLSLMDDPVQWMMFGESGLNVDPGKVLPLLDVEQMILRQTRKAELEAGQLEFPLYVTPHSLMPFDAQVDQLRLFADVEAGGPPPTPPPAGGGGGGRGFGSGGDDVLPPGHRFDDDGTVIPGDEFSPGLEGFFEMAKDIKAPIAMLRFALSSIRETTVPIQGAVKGWINKSRSIVDSIRAYDTTIQESHVAAAHYADAQAIRVDGIVVGTGEMLSQAFGPQALKDMVASSVKHRSIIDVLKSAGKGAKQGVKSYVATGKKVKGVRFVGDLSVERNIGTKGVPVLSSATDSGEVLVTVGHETIRVNVNEVTPATRKYIGTLWHIFDQPDAYMLNPKQRRAVTVWNDIQNNDLDVTARLGIPVHRIEEDYISHTLKMPNRAGGILGRSPTAATRPTTQKARRLTTDEFIELAEREGLEIETDLMVIMARRLSSAARMRASQVFIDGMSQKVKDLGGKVRVLESGEPGLRVGEGQVTVNGKNYAFTRVMSRTSPDRAIVDEINEAMKPLHEAPEAQILTEFVVGAREILLNFDVSVGGFRQGFLALMANPLGTLRGYYTAAKVLTSKEYMLFDMVENMDAYTNWAQHGLTLTVSPLDTTVGLRGQRALTVEKVPVVGAAVRWLNWTQFGVLMPRIKRPMADAYLSSLKAVRDNQGVSGIVESFPLMGRLTRKFGADKMKGMTDDELMVVVADAVNNMVGGADYARISIGERGVLRQVAFLTEGWTRAQAGIIINAPKNSPKGILARRMLMQEIIVAGLMAEGVNRLVGGETPFEFYDPRSTRFMVIETPWGDLHLMPHRTLFSTVAKSLLGVSEDAFGGESNEFWERAAGGLNWGEGRLGQLPRLGKGLVSGRTFKNERIDNRLKYALREMLLPILFQNVGRDLFIDKEPIGDILKRLPFEVLGANVAAPSPYRAADKAAREWAADNKVTDAAGDPIQSVWNLTSRARKDFEAAFPVLTAEVNTETQRRADRGVESAVRSVARKAVTTTRLEDEEGLVADLISGASFARNDEDYGAMMQQLRDAYANVQNDASVKLSEQDALYAFADPDKKERERPEDDDPNRQALFDYYDAFEEANIVANIMDWDKLDSLMKKLERNWTTEQQTFVETNTGLAEHHPFFQLLRRDQALLKSYWSLPKGGERIKARRKTPALDVALVRWYGLKIKTEEGRTAAAQGVDGILTEANRLFGRGAAQAAPQPAPQPAPAQRVTPSGERPRIRVRIGG